MNILLTIDFSLLTSLDRKTEKKSTWADEVAPLVKICPYSYQSTWGGFMKRNVTRSRFLLFTNCMLLPFKKKHFCV